MELLVREKLLVCISWFILFEVVFRRHVFNEFTFVPVTIKKLKKISIKLQWFKFR